MRIPEKYWISSAVAFGVAILAWALFGPQGVREVRKLRAERRQLVTEIDRLRAQRAALEKAVSRLRHDPRTIESRAREDLGMIRNGETVFLLPEPDDPDR